MVRKNVNANISTPDDPESIAGTLGDGPRHARVVVENESDTYSVLVGSQNEQDENKMFLLRPLQRLEFETRERFQLYGYRQAGDAQVSVLISALPEHAGLTVSVTPEAE